MSSEESGSADAAIDGAPVSRARGSGRRTAEHRKRQVEAGLVRIEGWVPQPFEGRRKIILRIWGERGRAIPTGSNPPPGARWMRAPRPTPVRSRPRSLFRLAQRSCARFGTGLSAGAPRENEKVALIVDAASRPSNQTTSMRWR